MSPSRWSIRGIVLTWCVAFLGGLFSPGVSAEDLRATTSLKYVPADAAYYSASLRNREQFENFRKSNAYQKLRNLPLVTFGLAMLEGQWNSDREEVRKAREVWEREETQQLVKVLLDAVSQEIFVYGDENITEVIKLTQEFQRAARAAQVRAARNSERDEETEQKLLTAVLEKLAQLKAPATIIGLRVSDSGAAEAQIARLEKFLQELFAREPDLESLKDRLTRKKIGEHSFLTLRLDGSLIPWDRLPQEVQDRVQESIRDSLTKMQLTISLGTRDGYLLLSLGESNDHLQRMGQGKLLIDRPEMTALRKNMDKPIVSIRYASAGLMRQANPGAGQIDDLVTTAETLLPLAKLEEADTAALVADVKQLAGELKEFIPQPGAVSSFAFLTDRGYEGYGYNWTENNSLDGSKKLDILDHVGGDPLGFFAARGKYAPETYDWCVKWLKRAAFHGEKNVLPGLDDAERQRYAEIREQVVPLLEWFDMVTRKELLPAFQNGQGAVVLDVKAMSKQWHRELPETRVSLPMLEFACVYAVNDSAAVKRAASEYFAIVQKALDVAHELGQGEVPKVTLPAPKLEKTDTAEIFSYPIPEAAGLDSQIAPNAGLSRDTLVLSTMPETTRRLLRPTPVKGVGPLADTDRPLASASYFNVAGLMDAIIPWVNYGVRIAGQGQGDNAGQARVAAQMVAGNVTPILEVLKCFGETASVTYLEDGAVVKHSATHFLDAN